MKRAYLYLKNITFGRIDAYPEDEGVKCAVVSVAEAMYLSDSRFGVSSENNDGYSVSFSGNSSGRTFYQIAARFLPPDMLVRRCGVIW